MRLFLLPQTFSHNKPLILTGKDFNYIVKVLRLKKGQLISARDKEGKPWNLCLIEIKKDSCILSVTQTDTAQETTDSLPKDRPKFKIVLYQCLPKGRKIDDIIRMATEVGVWKIILVNSQNCVSSFDKFDKEKEEIKIQRYNKIIREAIQQSGSLVATSIENPIDIFSIPEHFNNICNTLFLRKDTLQTNEDKTEGFDGEISTKSTPWASNKDPKTDNKAKVLFFHQEKLLETQQNIFQVLSDKVDPIGVIVGPEGGFSKEETSFFLSHSFYPVLLKTNILRTETAAVYSIATTQTILETNCQ